MTAPLLVREVLPEASAEVDIAAPEGRDWLARRYSPDGARIRLNMVTSLTGSAAGGDGTSESLTSRVDRTILAAIRRSADVVVVGAGTVRAERYLRPRDGVLAVLTASGRVDAPGLRSESDRVGRVLLVCPAGREAEASDSAGAIGAEVVAIPSVSGSLGPGDVVAALRQRGLERIVCEGGPTVASQFVAAGIVDELCITVAPVLAPASPSGPFLRLDAASVPSTAVAGMLVDRAGFTYLRLRPSR